MISKTMQDALNQQIANEFAASYLYLSMSGYCEARSLRGFAHWLRLQSQEEALHANKLFDIVLDRGGQVTLLAIEAPPSDFESPLDVMQRVLSHEQQVTAMFQELYELAARESDSTTQTQLQWFITEQVEEEQAANTIVDQLRLIGSQGSALFLLDRELAGRTPKA